MKHCLALLLLIMVSLGGLRAQDEVQLRKLTVAAYSMMDAYVDSIPADTLVEAAIRAMLSRLDPHSTYMNAAEVKRFNEQMSGKFFGIGIMFNIVRDTVVVIQTVPDGPAEKAGMMAGDKVVQVGDRTIAGCKLPTDAVMSLIRGAEGSSVRLGVVRAGVDGLMTFDVVRGKVDVRSVDVVLEIERGVGYVRLLNFGSTTADEFSKALASLARSGVRSVIIDLRGNGGGYLGSAVDIVSEFIPAGELVVYTVGRGGRRRDIKARRGGRYRSVRVVALVDDYTASAAEILSGTLQDYDRGLVIGRRTFGKGLVQNVLDLPDGSMIRLTTSRYYLPSGRMIQKPYDEGQSAYAHELVQRYEHGEMFSVDSIDFPDSLKYRTLHLGRTVYGGGGVMPDIFVPLDTARYNRLHRDIIAKGCLARAALTFVGRNREDMYETYDSDDDFVRRFEVDDKVFGLIVDDARASGIDVDTLMLEEARPQLSLQLKGLIARDLWDVASYTKVVAPVDEMLQEALRVLSDGTYERILAPQSEGRRKNR